MRDIFDILIIGGGAIGLALARELARLQAGRVCVVERGRAGGGASYAAAGMLSPNAECEAIDDFYQLCDESRKRFPEFADELFAETGIDIELDRSGTIFAAFTGDDSRHLGQRYDAQVAAGIPVERWTAEQTLRAEPNISPKVRGCLYFANDWQVENRKLVAALERYARLNGVSVITGSAVNSLLFEGDQLVGVAAGDRRIYADVTVLATGAWTSLIKIGGAPLPIADVKPIRGQMIGFRPVGKLFKKVIYGHRGYLVPRADGRVLIGATVEDVGFDDRVTEEGIEALTAAANEMAPCLGRFEIADSWSGLRPYAAGGRPVIGPLPEFGGAYVATAHYRNGILLAPITAKLLADRIVKSRDSRFLEIFGPDSSLRAGLTANA